jgi:hypothetical protein
MKDVDFLRAILDTSILYVDMIEKSTLSKGKERKVKRLQFGFCKCDDCANLKWVAHVKKRKGLILVSKKAFENYKKLCKEFIQDYKYGIFVRFGMKILLKTGLMHSIIRLAKKSPRFYNMLYDSVSAENSYKNIFLNFFKRQKK